MMKSKFVLAIGLFSLLASFSLHKQKERIVFFGDSITQAGTGPDGFISVIGEQLKVRGMANNYELIGAGISGDKVTNLYLRLDMDVLVKKPDKVVIWIGVNDVWHKEWGTGTDTYTFEKYYELIINKLQSRKIEVVMCTPAVIGEKADKSNGRDGDLDKYSDIIRRMASKYKCALVDLRKLFIEHNATYNKEQKSSGILTSDGVHLNAAGNEFVAEQLMKVVFGG